MVDGHERTDCRDSQRVQAPIYQRLRPQSTPLEKVPLGNIDSGLSGTVLCDPHIDVLHWHLGREALQTPKRVRAKISIMVREVSLWLLWGNWYMCIPRWLPLNTYRGSYELQSI